MSSVWYAIPCANYSMALKTLPVWKSKGYKIALLCDQDRAIPEAIRVTADVIITPWSRANFKGYPAAVKYLIDHAIPASVPVIVCGGDDMYPDPNFSAGQVRMAFESVFPDLFGVMQPCGDKLGWQESTQNHAAERICGSPILGRRFIDEANSGLGPFWPGYFHMFCDEELFNVSKLLGCLNQAKGLTHYHEHWTRTGSGQPEHMNKAQAMWDADKALFEKRRAAGFPGHDRIKRG